MHSGLAEISQSYQSKQLTPTSFHSTGIFFNPHCFYNLTRCFFHASNCIRLTYLGVVITVHRAVGHSAWVTKHASVLWQAIVHIDSKAKWQDLRHKKGGEWGRSSDKKSTIWSATYISRHRDACGAETLDDDVVAYRYYVVLGLLLHFCRMNLALIRTLWVAAGQPERVSLDYFRGNMKPSFNDYWCFVFPIILLSGFSNFVIHWPCVARA